MKQKIFTHAVIVLTIAVLFAACSKEAQNKVDKSLPDNREVTKNQQGAASDKSTGAEQISGTASYDPSDACNAASQGATFSLIMTGDLQGCLFTYVDDYKCSPSGTYREVGREYFVGTYNGTSGTFWTNYKFEAKYEGCAVNGSYVGFEIKGRCQHPVAKGSGTGVFAGVTGRLDMKDNVEAGNATYRGHFAW